MGKIITFAPNGKRRPRKVNSRPDAPDQTTVKLMLFADELDRVLLAHLQSGDSDPMEAAAVLAHRLGELLSHIDNKDALWEFCRKIIEGRASVA